MDFDDDESATQPNNLAWIESSPDRIAQQARIMEDIQNNRQKTLNDYVAPQANRKKAWHVYSNFLELYVVYIEVNQINYEHTRHLIDIMGGLFVEEYDSDFVTHVLVDSPDA